MELKVIRGGEQDSVLTSKKVFLKAISTNTRLMGVTAVHAIFLLPDNLKYKICHMFFYFDSEEFNFDTYERVLSTSLDDKKTLPYIEEIEIKMMGGLGANLVEITEKELRALVTYYYQKTIKANDTLPEGCEEYKFLITPKTELNNSELNILFDKICEELTTNNQVITYFLMRLIGDDLILAKYLTDNSFEINGLGYKNACLLKNTIKELSSDMSLSNDDPYFSSFKTELTYFTESLIDSNNNYYILTSEIKVKNHKVVSFKKLKSFRVTSIEADFMTKREEFISLYEFSFPNELIFNFKTKLSKFSMSNVHENGIVNMIFNENNNHVKNDIFNLSDDVKGVQYITKYNQILLLSYSKEGLREMEKDLRTSKMISSIEKVDTFRFTNPVFYSFVNADYEDFLDYIDDIKE